MEACRDFLQRLGPDMAIDILLCLDDPCDLVRVCAVSSSWRRFVIANGLSKQLCIRKFPEGLSIAHHIEVDNVIEPVEACPESSTEWDRMKRDHRIYAILARGLTSSTRKDCILEAISASSTDNYPDESIDNTLESRDRVEQRASYWSSEGESDPTIPETLVYKLKSKLCVITEIHVQPFQAFFQYGFPIYSAKAVRFRMGHLRSPNGIGSDSGDELEAVNELNASAFIWSYTSPEFPMAQENQLQKFKLPEPVLCIGGILQVELLGRVQIQEMDSLYYICIAHVQVVGRLLSLPFDIEILDPSGRCSLTYCPEAKHCSSPTRAPVEGEASEPSRFRTLASSVRGWEHAFLNTILGGGVVIDGHYSDDDAGNDSDDELVA